ncbi:hypothetical protein ABPG74_019384 [Tetrahymena malaccensis]
MNSVNSLVSTQYVSVGSTNKNTLKALPAKQKQKIQTFTIGDDNGYIYIFEYQKNEHVLVSKSAQSGKEINHVQLGYSQQSENDRIFYSTGTSIKAMSRKGKEVFKGESKSSDLITKFQVEGNSIWGAGKYLFTEFDIQSESQMRDKYDYLSNELINCMYSSNILEGNKIQSILACGDNTLRAIQDDTEVMKYNLTSLVNHMKPYSTQYQLIQSKTQEPKTYLCATNDGELIMLDMQLTRFKNQPTLLWQLKNSENGINLFDSFDFYGKGNSDLLVSYEDSTIELLQSNINGELEVAARKTVEEQVTSVEGGYFTQQGVSEFLISTFSGRVLGIQETNQKFASQTQIAPSSKTDLSTVESEKVKNNALAIQKLKDDISNLEKLAEELQKKCVSEDGHVALVNEVNIKIDYKLTINQSDASYNLNLSCQYPLELIALQSNLKLEIIDVDSKGAIKSISPEDPSNESLFLATYRMPEQNIQKIEFKLRTYEGKSGDIKVHIITSPYPMNCQVLNVPIKPLSLHVRTNEIPSQEMPMNDLIFTGEFQAKEIHYYVQEMIPDIPVLNHDEEVKYVFKSSLVGSYLVCTYNKGKAVFQSDSVSTIAIVKDFINNQLNQRGTIVNVKWNINDKSIPHMIELLKPLFEDHKSQTIKLKIVPALKELKLQDEEIDFMTPEMKQILQNSDQILKDYGNLPQKIEYLKGIVSDLVFDRATLKELDDPSNKIDTIIQYLEKYDYDRVIKYILG